MHLSTLSEEDLVMLRDSAEAELKRRMEDRFITVWLIIDGLGNRMFYVDTDTAFNEFNQLLLEVLDVYKNVGDFDGKVRERYRLYCLVVSKNVDGFRGNMRET